VALNGGRIMSDYDFRSPASDPQGRAPYARPGGSGSTAWLVAAGIVILLVLGLAFLGGDTSPTADDGLEILAPAGSETAPAAPVTE